MKNANNYYHFRVKYLCNQHFDSKGYIYVYAKKKMHESLPYHYAFYYGSGRRGVYGR